MEDIYVLGNWETVDSSSSVGLPRELFDLSSDEINLQQNDGILTIERVVKFYLHIELEPGFRQATLYPRSPKGKVGRGKR